MMVVRHLFDHSFAVSWVTTASSCSFRLSSVRDVSGRPRQTACKLNTTQWRVWFFVSFNCSHSCNTHYIKSYFVFLVSILVKTVFCILTHINTQRTCFSSPSCRLYLVLFVHKSVCWRWLGQSPWSWRQKTLLKRRWASIRLHGRTT